MATWAEFEEKEYETLANAAFVMNRTQRSQDVRIFSPGQALEEQLGYDFATRVDPHGLLYRRLFGSTPGAAGVNERQQVAHQIPVSATTHLLNVFLQYKRPEHFAVGHRSSDWPKNQAHLAFWVREHVTKDKDPYAQIATLRQLELDLGSDAIVRYACPSTSSKQDLYDRFADRTLLTTSTFVSPALLELDPPPGFHERWRFDPLSPRRGVANPQGIEREAMDGGLFFDVLEDRLRQLEVPRGIGEVLMGSSRRTSELRFRLAAAREEQPEREREERAREASELERELRAFEGPEEELVRATVDVAVLARDLRVTWFLVADGSSTANAGG